MILGLILSGGKSKRMGRDKNSLVINGHTMLDIAYKNMSGMSFDYLLLANKSGENPPISNLESVADVEGFHGPSGGIVAGLRWAEQNNMEWVQLCPIDLPLLNPKIFTILQAMRREGINCVVAKSNTGIEPLLSLIHTKSFLEIIAANMHNKLNSEANGDGRQKGMSIHRLISQANYLEVDEKVLLREGIEENCFWNVNTPVEYEKILAVINR